MKHKYDENQITGIKGKRRRYLRFPTKPPHGAKWMAREIKKRGTRHTPNTVYQYSDRWYLVDPNGCLRLGGKGKYQK